MRCRQDAVQAIMIDMQERLLPAMAEKEKVLESSVKLTKGLEILGVPVIASQQYTKGLGETVEPLRGIGGVKFFEKITFSCMDEPAICDAVIPEKKQVRVYGVEIHVCVQATVLDLIERGYTVFLPSDCVSSRKLHDKEAALRRMEQAGAIITTYESLLYDLTVRAGTPVFKQISALTK